MKHMHMITRLALLAVAVGLLTGCLPLAATPPSAAAPAAAASGSEAVTAVPSATPAATPTGSGIVVSTSVAGPSSGPLPASTTAAPLPPATAPANGLLEVTTADYGRTIELRVGERLLLNLGEGGAWAVEIADPLVLGPLANASIPEGAQGVFAALASGTTTLTAVNAPACLQARPPCKLPIRTFEVTAVVK